MLPIRSHARRQLLAGLSGDLAPLGRRGYRLPTAAHRDLLKAPNAVAKKLDATDIWAPAKERKKPAVRADKTRVNVVSKALCNDIVDYLGDSLLRHKGCDLIDLYPGAGVWSRKLHDLLQPRSHIFLEPDDDLYTPFLQPLLNRPGVRLVPKAGIVWADLNSVLSPEFLPHQTPRPWGPDTPPERNDTLLVTMNLATFPRRRFSTFESMASLVLFQLLSSMRSGSIFQRYGLVRLLVWTNPEDKGRLVPRTVQSRNRAAIDAELNTEWVREVAGLNNTLDPDTRFTFHRDMNIDVEGTAQVAARMRAHGIVTPPGRETDLLRHVLDMGGTAPAAADQAPAWRFSDDEERLELAEAFESGQIERDSPEIRRYHNLKNYHAWKLKRSGAFFGIDAERRAIVNLQRAGSPDAAAREAAWNESMIDLDRKLRQQYLLYRDNMHIFSQDPQVLMWDRRPYEPLRVQPDEFFPNVPLALVDIQPRATHPLLRDMGRHSRHAADYFELILRSLLQNGTQAPSRALESVAPGCSDAVVPHCPSLRDPAVGGSSLGGFGEVSCRTMNERQLMEILQAWMDWPLKPTYAQLVGRLTDTEDPEEDE